MYVHTAANANFPAAAVCIMASRGGGGSCLRIVSSMKRRDVVSEEQMR